MARNGTSRGHNSLEFTVTNPSTEEECKVIAQYSWYYDPGVWTYPNGDPGYPPESEVEMKSWEMADNEPKPEWLTEELVEETFYEQDTPFEDDYEPDYEPDFD